MRINAAMISLAGGLCGSAAADELTPAEIFQAVSPSVVVVEALNSESKAVAQGSGVVTEPGVVITNCHVLKKAKAARVRVATQKWTAHVRHKDEARDLCSLSVAGLTAPSVTKRGASTLNVGESVYALGAPQGFELSLSNGIISSLRKVDGGTMLQVTAPISPGSSGGGLFDADGRLVGITTLYWKESQQLNFAVPADWIEDLPRRGGQKNVSLDSTSREGGPSLSSGTEAAPNVRSDETARAIQQLRDYDSYMLKNDPSYAAKRPKLNALVHEIRKSRPPEEWLQATSDAYLSIDDVHPSTVSGRAGSSSHQDENRWLVVSRDSSKEVAIDRDSIKREGEVVSVWYRGVFAVPSSTGSLAGVKRQMEQLRFECNQATYTLRAQVLFSGDGAVLHQTGMLPSTWKPVVPGTVNEKVMHFVCE